MPQITIDFDVFKAITARRASESMTENDLLRQLFNLPPRPTAAPTVVNNNSSQGGDWISKGVRFPAGTEFRANYKGEEYIGRVADGALVVNGQRYSTPSSAAMSITRGSVNGWSFWECKMPGKSWQKLLTLRK